MTDSRRDKRIDKKLLPDTQKLQSGFEKMIELEQSVLYDLNKLTKQLDNFSNPSAQGEAEKTRTVADEMFVRIKSHQETIVGFDKMNKALNKLSRMLFYSELQSRPIKDIIALWRNDISYDAVFSPSPKYSGTFLSEAPDALFDQRQFLISIENEFGCYTPSEAMQTQSMQNKC